MVQLTEGQKKAVETIKHFLQDQDASTFGLFGYAGTGKSFVTKHLVNDYKGQVFLTASTNKATSVMKYMWRGTKTQKVDNQFSTIYKLFGYFLQPSLNRQTGEWEEKLVKSQTWEPPFETVNGHAPLVIVDEASMIPKDFYDKLLGYIPYFDLKLLFIGDPGQLPPVGEKISPVFERLETQWTDTWVTLTEVVRQSKDSEILRVATEVRENLKAINPCKEVNIDHSSRDDFSAAAIDQFKQNASFLDTKVIAWRNDTVEWYNNRIRTTLKTQQKGPKECPFDIGDPVISKKPVYKGRETLLYTSQEMIVKDIKEGKKSGISTFELTLESDYEPAVKVHIVKPSNMKTYLSKVSWYKTRAKKTNADRDWMIYKQFVYGFASLDYSYAITAHKSQGSTYKNTFVDVRDILDNGAIEERNKCLYVAVSRPTDKLILRW